MGNALFIIWRESAEAMLVVGILYAWLRKQPDMKRGMRYLWAGVGAGIGLALALAAVMLGIAKMLSDEGLEYFQLAMMLIASGLIVQMVFWMRRHGRTFKRDLEANMQTNAEAANWWGLLVVVALAVGRESAETVVFLYGLGSQYTSAWSFLQVLALGLGAAWLTFWVLQQGSKYLLVANVLSRERDPAPAPRRRAPRFRCREDDRARRAAGVGRSALGHVRRARRHEPRRRPPRGVHRLSCAPGAHAAAPVRHVLDSGRHVAAAILSMRRCA